jgi:hypothetical protein
LRAPLWSRVNGAWHIVLFHNSDPPLILPRVHAKAHKLPLSTPVQMAACDLSKMIPYCSRTKKKQRKKRRKRRAQRETTKKAKEEKESKIILGF